MNFKVLSLGLAVLATFWISIVPVCAQVLIQIDVSNPNSVKFIATTGASSATVTGFVYADGITLTDFLTTAVTPLTADNTSDSSLQPHGSGTAYYGIFVDSLSGSSRDVNFFSNFFSTPESFTQNVQAFDGSVSWDLSDANHAEIRDALPAIGATGTVYVGTSIDLLWDQNPVAIGTWEVIGSPVEVPEPSTVLLFAGGLGMLVLVFHRRGQRLANVCHG